MNAPYIISQLEYNIGVFDELFSFIPADLITWRSQPEKWNLLEIICHLYDEERDDFRARLKLVLENPNEPFPKIDPPGWVQSRDYKSRNFNDMLEKFIAEREASIQWLKSLVDPPLDNAFVHPKFGPFSGKLLLSNWLAHDYLHFRQVTKLKYDYLAFSSGEKLDYAGNW